MINPKADSTKQKYYIFLWSSLTKQIWTNLTQHNILDCNLIIYTQINTKIVLKIRKYLSNTLVWGMNFTLSFIFKFRNSSFGMCVQQIDDYLGYLLISPFLWFVFVFRLQLRRLFLCITLSVLLLLLLLLLSLLLLVGISLAVIFAFQRSSYKIFVILCCSYAYV